MVGVISRRAMLSGLSATTVLVAGSCKQRSAHSPNPVHIATAAGGLNLTLAEMLHQLKYLESFDLNPDIVAMADGARILGATYSGTIDIAPISGVGQLFPAVEHGADLKIINASTLTPMLALFSSKPKVRSVQDLEGKVVGVGALGSLVHQLTVTLLRKYSVDIASVRFVSIGSNVDIFRGVMAGTVDAGVGSASLLGDESSYKVHAIEHGDMSVELTEFTYQAGWTTSRLIDSKRDMLVRVLAAYAKLFRFVTQPSAQQAFLQARRVVFPSAADREHQNEWTFLQKVKPFALDLKFSPVRVRYLQQINLDFRVQKEILPYERVVDMSLAQDALKLLG
jgi:ABC-type nitrate/sulfonate/bicarbonate transport system substrate-binding protein